MKIALVGIGKIALDQHVPAIAASPDWELAATISRKGSVDGVESYDDFAAFLAARPDVLVKGGDWPVEKMVGAKEVQSWGGTALSIAFEHERSTTATLEKIRKL